MMSSASDGTPERVGEHTIEDPQPGHDVIMGFPHSGQNKPQYANGSDGPEATVCPLSHTTSGTKSPGMPEGAA